MLIQYKYRIRIVIFIIISLYLLVIAQNRVNADNNKIVVTINGNPVKFDVDPLVINDRVLVQIRPLAQTIGCSVEWDDPTKTIYINQQNYPINMNAQRGEEINVYVNNNKISFPDQKPVIIDGCLMIPSRSVVEALGGTVVWDDNTKTQIITTNKANTEIALTPTPVSSAGTNIGTRTNPLPAKNNAKIAFQQSSFEKVKNINIQAKSVIRGNSANSIVSSENHYNKTPGAGQEWRIYTFNLQYLSCDSDEELIASDIIFDRNFYTRQGTSLKVYETGTTGDIYKGNDIFDVKLYPGSNSDVVIMMLVNKNEGIPLLRIPIKGSKDYVWLLCDAAVTVPSSSSSQGISQSDKSNNMSSDSKSTSESQVLLLIANMINDSQNDINGMVTAIQLDSSSLALSYAKNIQKRFKPLESINSPSTRMIDTVNNAKSAKQNLDTAIKFLDASVGANRLNELSNQIDALNNLNNFLENVNKCIKSMPNLNS